MEENGVPAKNYPKSKLRMALPQILAVMVKNMLMLSYGTTLGYPAILIPSLTGQDPSETIIASETDISWISSLNKLIVPISSIISGITTEPIGRKRSMQCITVPMVAGWLILRFSSDLWQIYFAIAIFGICGGLIEAPVQTYVAEITQPEYRGMLSIISSSITVLGILIQYTIGAFFNWRESAVISCIFPITAFILLMFIPESPYWLIRHNNEKLARKNLAWFRGWTTVEEIELEFQQIVLETAEKRNKFESSTKLESDSKCFIKVTERLRRLKRFSDKDFLCPFFIVMIAFFINHFTGSTTLFTYAVLIFQNLKVPINEYYATIVVGVASVLGCIIATIVIKYTGKRKLMFISLIGMIISTLGVAIYSYVVGIEEFIVVNETESADNTYGVIPLVFIILLAFTSFVGVRNLPWVLLVELYPEDIRGSACGLSSGLGYLFGFLANKLFLDMLYAFTIPGVYLFHGILGIVGFILFYFILPETEGRSLQEISDHFLGISKLGTKYIRKVK